MKRIKCVTSLDGYRLKIMIDDGSEIILNLESRLHTVRFSMLTDKEFFKKATTDGICVTWEGKIEISLSEIFQLAQ